MADLDLTAAIEAGKATHVGYAPDGPTMRLVEASIRAAAPVIERAVREQIADEMEATFVTGAPIPPWAAPGGKLRASSIVAWAASIARGQTEEQP